MGAGVKRRENWDINTAQGGAWSAERTSDGKTWRDRANERLDDARDAIARKLSDPERS